MTLSPTTIRLHLGKKVTYQMNDTTRGNATIDRVSSTKGKVYIVTETEGTLFVSIGELELRG